jgi:hypothetical protein
MYIWRTQESMIFHHIFFYFFHFPRIYSWIYSNLLMLHRFYTIISVLISFTRKVRMLISFSLSLTHSLTSQVPKEGNENRGEQMLWPFCTVFVLQASSRPFSLFLLCLNSGLISYTEVSSRYRRQSPVFYYGNW